MLLLAMPLLRALVVAAEAAYPEEACALLVGRRGVGDRRMVDRVELSRNIAADRRRRFEVDPGLRIGLERELRGTEDIVLGVWHSHPDGAATPSATDLAMAYEPELAWLITAVSQGEAVQTAAYLLSDDARRFRPVPLVLRNAANLER